MKSRRVVITIELKSSTPLKTLKQEIKDCFLRWDYDVLRVQGNVIQEKK